MVTEIVEGVYWVGVVDWALRHFHGYELSTPRGSTYNSYLIKDEKTVLVDTVWGPFADDFVANVREVVDPGAIDIVVANHAEADHSGGLPAIMRHCPDAAVVVSRRGAESIPGHYHEDWNFKAVGTGDKLNIGKHELVFVEAPMLHWPDSMFTYLAGKNILMPNDAFGQHYATDRRFNDEVDQLELYEEALRYYANILTPFSDLVLKKIEEVLALGLPVDMIAPSHGVIWRDNPLQIVEKYKEWASQVPEQRAVILYDTMWHGTRHMAEAVGAGLAAEGVPYKIFYAPVADRNQVLTDARPRLQKQDRRGVRLVRLERRGGRDDREPPRTVWNRGGGAGRPREVATDRRRPGGIQGLGPGRRPGRKRGLTCRQNIIPNAFSI